MVVALLVTIVVLAGAAAAWRHGHQPETRHAAPAGHPAGPLDGQDGLDPGDVADLDDRFRLVSGEERLLQQTLLQSRVQPLVTRRVPVRGVEALPELRTVRVRFADGTAIVANGEIAGDAARLALLVRHDQHVVASSCSAAPDGKEGMRVVFAWSGERHHIALRVSGLDQPA